MSNDPRYLAFLALWHQLPLREQAAIAYRMRHKINAILKNKKPAPARTTAAHTQAAR